MAEKEKKELTSRKIGTILKNITQGMDNIYRDTYSSTKSNHNDLENISKNIEDNINNIISRNGNTDISNISKLYSRMKLKSTVGEKDLYQGVEELFGDKTITDALLTTYVGNKWIKDLDNEIDTVLRYMPELLEALNAKKDAVLSSDNFEKDFINATCSGINEEEQGIFSERIEEIKEKYNISEKFEEYYDNTGIYGEQFIYIVPYNKVISDLLDRKDSTQAPQITGSLFREEVIIENGVIPKDKVDQYDTLSKLDKVISNKTNLSLIMDNRGFLESVIRSMSNTEKFIEKNNVIGLNEYASIVKESGNTFDRIIDDDFEIPKELKSDFTSSDGFIGANNKPSKNKVKVPGCLIKKLERDRVIPIYVDEICLGYYYLEFLMDDKFYENINDFSNTMAYGAPIAQTQTADNGDQQREEVLRYISGTLSSQIDKNFVNSNQDLSEEIYAVLKHNDMHNNFEGFDNSIKVTFIPEEDIVHMTFKKDEKTHRGISDILGALIPAKLYSCLYITNTIGILTRGQDKRVYYVKQNVETNISQTLLNVINQIKRGNFGVRQIENMNNILNITGRFNDYIIPTNQSGDPPIQFEIMQGQDIDPNTELMDRLKEMAVNSTDVPLDVIQARLSMDFATQLTMSNTKFLRHVYRRQGKCERYYSEILTKIYNNEYGENKKVDCVLPTPVFLNVNNINNILDNTKTLATSLAELEYDMDQDESAQIKKSIFIKNFIRDRLNSYIKSNEIDKIKNITDIEYQSLKKPTDEESV